MKLPSPPGPLHKPVSEALVEFQKAKTKFVNTVNELLAKGDPGVDVAFLEGNLLPMLYNPLVQGATLDKPNPAPLRNDSTSLYSLCHWFTS
jgi:hypothetical protein